MAAAIEKASGFRAWLNKRLPVDQFMADQLTGYYAPKNFNIWYFFGSLALLVFVMQIVTGIFITMHFKPGEATAFDSVEYLVREVPYGWLIQLHARGRRVVLLHRRLPAHGARAACTAATRRRASCCGSSACSSISRSWPRPSWATCCPTATCPTGARR